MVALVRHSRRKRGATDRPDLTPPRQSSTLHSRGSTKPGRNTYVAFGSLPSLRVDPDGADDVRIKSGTENVVQYMPEGFMGWDLKDQAVDLGTVDKHGVVKFYAKYNLGDMPLSELKKLGGEDSIKLLLKAIRARQAVANADPEGYLEGTHPSDYYRHRVTQQECSGLTDEEKCWDETLRENLKQGKEDDTTPFHDVRKACMMRMGVAAARRTGLRTTGVFLLVVGAVGTPVGLGLALSGGHIAVKIGGVVLLIGGVASLGVGVSKTRHAYKMGEAVRKAAIMYCDCGDLR